MGLAVESEALPKRRLETRAVVAAGVLAGVRAIDLRAGLSGMRRASLEPALLFGCLLATPLETAGGVVCRLALDLGAGCIRREVPALADAFGGGQLCAGAVDATRSLRLVAALQLRTILALVELPAVLHAELLGGFDASVLETAATGGLGRTRGVFTRVALFERPAHLLALLFANDGALVAADTTGAAVRILARDVGAALAGIERAAESLAVGAGHFAARTALQTARALLAAALCVGAALTGIERAAGVQAQLSGRLFAGSVGVAARAAFGRLALYGTALLPLVEGPVQLDAVPGGELLAGLFRGDVGAVAGVEPARIDGLGLDAGDATRGVRDRTLSGVATLVGREITVQLSTFGPGRLSAASAGTAGPAIGCFALDFSTGVAGLHGTALALTRRLVGHLTAPLRQTTRLVLLAALHLVACLAAVELTADAPARRGRGLDAAASHAARVLFGSPTIDVGALLSSVKSAAGSVADSLFGFGTETAGTTGASFVSVVTVDFRALAPVEELAARSIARCPGRHSAPALSATRRPVGRGAIDLPATRTREGPPTLVLTLDRIEHLACPVQTAGGALVHTERVGARISSGRQSSLHDAVVGGQHLALTIQATRLLVRISALDVVAGVAVLWRSALARAFGRGRQFAGAVQTTGAGLLGVGRGVGVLLVDAGFTDAFRFVFAKSRDASRPARAVVVRGAAVGQRCLSAAASQHREHCRDDGYRREKRDDFSGRRMRLRGHGRPRVRVGNLVVRPYVRITIPLYPL